MAVERPPSGGSWQPTPAPPAPRPTGGGTSAPAPTPQGNAPLTAAAGSPVSKYTWALALVHAMGGTPTPAIINLVIAWIDKEGTKAAWNPLAITGHAPGSTTFGSPGSNTAHAGVQNFTSFDQGVQTTAQFLLNSSHYQNIVAAIRLGNPDLAFAHLNEFDTWGGTAGYGSSLVGVYRSVSGDPNAGAGGLLAANGGGGTTGGLSPAVTSALSADPSLEWALGVPEVAGILQQAASQNWTDSQLTAALQGSDYYKSHSAQIRAWQALQTSDPASAARNLQAAEASLRAQAASLGLTLSDSALAGLAMGEEMFQWNSDEIHQHLLAASAFSQSSSLGSIGDGAVQARQLFAQYGIKLDDQSAQQYGLQINTASDPTSALENIRPIAIAQAKGLFPSLAPQLDQGVTVAQVFTPYANAAANLLEVDPSQIDLTDPKYSRALQGDNKQGQMNLDQWQSTIMSDPRYGWDRTGNARASAVQLTQQLGATFGVSA